MKGVLLSMKQELFFNGGEIIRMQYFLMAEKAYEGVLLRLC